MIDKLIAKLSHYDCLSGEEEQALRAAAGKVVGYKRGETIVEAREEQSSSKVVLDGIVHSFKDLNDGSRQSLLVAVPGDFVDLHSLIMKQVDHNLAALTDCRLILFPHDQLLKLTSEYDHLARLLWLSTVVDAAIHREWMLSLGVRSSAARLAHLLCELQVRLAAVGLADQGSYELPLTQEELSDILAMTPVHMNRTLRLLREQNLVTFRGKTVEIHDWGALCSLAEFDPFYLNLQRRPR